MRRQKENRREKRTPFLSLLILLANMAAIKLCPAPNVILSSPRVGQQLQRSQYQLTGYLASQWNVKSDYNHF
jgi:hypothetical protein